MKRNLLITKNLDQEVRNAIWQYFLDHSKRQRNGYYGFLFYVKDENDFWDRVEYRYTGGFIRNKMSDEEFEKSRNNNIFSELYYFKRIAKKHNEVVQKIKLENNFYKKIILFFYRKSRNYLFND